MITGIKKKNKLTEIWFDETIDDLYADREKIQRDMNTLITRRTKEEHRQKKSQRRERDAR